MKKMESHFETTNRTIAIQNFQISKIESQLKSLMTWKNEVQCKNSMHHQPRQKMYSEEEHSDNLEKFRPKNLCGFTPTYP